MKIEMLSFKKYFLLFLLILITSLSISACRENHIDADTAKLSMALRDKGITIPEEIDYSDLIEKIRDRSVEVPGPFENATMVYLDNHADSLIQLPTSKPGILSWHLEKLFFIEKDLVFASFSDGEMYGVDLIVEIVHSGDHIDSMKTVWNYHK